MFEGLKSGPLRSLLRILGIPKDQIKEEGLKLSAFLCQLATIAKKEHWSLTHDAEEVVKNWDKDARLDFYKPLFALNGLRLADAHALSVDNPTAQVSNLKAFDIEPDKFKIGWGLALDRVYDEIAKSLQAATTLLQIIQALRLEIQVGIEMSCWHDLNRKRMPAPFDVSLHCRAMSASERKGRRCK